MRGTVVPPPLAHWQGQPQAWEDAGEREREREKERKEVEVMNLVGIIEIRQYEWLMVEKCDIKQNAEDNYLSIRLVWLPEAGVLTSNENCWERFQKQDYLKGDNCLSHILKKPSNPQKRIWNHSLVSSVEEQMMFHCATALTAQADGSSIVHLHWLYLLMVSSFMLLSHRPDVSSHARQPCHSSPWGCAVAAGGCRLSGEHWKTELTSSVKQQTTAKMT